jgi:hypothetical protein
MIMRNIKELTQADLEDLVHEVSDAEDRIDELDKEADESCPEMARKDWAHVRQVFSLLAREHIRGVPVPAKSLVQGSAGETNTYVGVTHGVYFFPADRISEQRFMELQQGELRELVQGYADTTAAEFIRDCKQRVAEQGSCYDKIYKHTTVEKVHDPGELENVVVYVSTTDQPLPMKYVINAAEGSVRAEPHELLMTIDGDERESLAKEGKLRKVRVYFAHSHSKKLEREHVAAYVMSQFHELYKDDTGPFVDDPVKQGAVIPVVECEEGSRTYSELAQMRERRKAAARLVLGRHASVVVKN